MEAVAVGCTSPGCNILFTWRNGYRTCKRCSGHFCYAHCNVTKRMSGKTYDPKGVECLVCNKCAAFSSQNIGVYRNHFPLFQSTRRQHLFKVNATIEPVINRIKQFTKEEAEKQRLELAKKRAQAQQTSSYTYTDALSYVTPTVSSTMSSVTSWLKLNSAGCQVCSRQFAYFDTRFLCSLCTKQCCQTCAKYETSIGRTLFNDAPGLVKGYVRCCILCKNLIETKERVLKFNRIRERCEQENKLQLLYSEIVASKTLVERALKKYFDLIMAEQVQALQKEFEEENDEEIHIVWEDDLADKPKSATSHLTPEMITAQKDATATISSFQLKFKAFVEHLQTQEKGTKPEILQNVRQALVEWQHDTILPFCKAAAF
eukprot:TRINITY_DN7671_c0_g1_i1.p1 TRINITY_DN7671_c0_g1~~TRINITY_DN7671_c0_g1_i1.p1  ORF type:complete len:373 (+),score=16.87 TRINITY_DN7671_c0_g1_i1:103-1221(+)